MTDPQLSADHTGPHARRGHLHNLQSDVIWKRPAVDEDSSELVHPALALEGVSREQRRHGGQGRGAGERLHLAALVITVSAEVIAHHHPLEVINVTNEVIIDVGPEHA